MGAGAPDCNVWRMRVRFAPKVPVGWLEQLYRRDALGIQDEDLVDKVAARLYARCRDVLLVGDSRVKCLECGTVFEVPWIGQPPSLARRCPGCGWTITAGEYHASFEHQDLLGINARVAFSEFVASLPRSNCYRERMLLVDRLVHAVHAGGNSVARNLIEGRAREVLARLKALAQR
jgi:hypothetical protein